MSLLYHVQTDCVTHCSCDPVGTRDSLPGVNVVGVSTEEAESSPTAPASLVHGTHIMQLWRSAFHPIMENVEFVYPDSATTTFFQIISN